MNPDNKNARPAGAETDGFGKHSIPTPPSHTAQGKAEYRKLLDWIEANRPDGNLCLWALKVALAGERYNFRFGAPLDAELVFALPEDCSSTILDSRIWHRAYALQILVKDLREREECVFEELCDALLGKEDK